MRIHPNMSLADLAERMGGIATRGEAHSMRALLVERYDGQDTADVPERDWGAMLDTATRQA